MVLALDSNILILAFNAFYKPTPLGIKAQEILSTIDRTNPQVFLSVLVFEEFLVRIYKENLEKKISYYEDFITRGGTFTVKDIDRHVARMAAQIRADYPNIRTPDAIHLASAIECGAKTFITADKRLPDKIRSLIIEKI